MEGFVGGACSREIVRKQALACIRVRHARLVSITPDAGAAGGSDPEHVVVPMMCASEGAVDVYIEPSVRPRRLVVVGTSPVAEALTRTALAIDYEVVRVVDADEQRDLEHPSAALGFAVAPLESLDDVLNESGGEAAAVVASQGHYDERALETILRSGAAYVGLVASRKRGGTVRKVLEESGVTGLDAVRIPAGLDLGARTAPEVALSILAEIVQRSPEQGLDAARAAAEKDRRTAAPARAATAVDPVCHMEVEIATARHTAETGGSVYYFCCAHCRTLFVKDPAPFLAARP